MNDEITIGGTLYISSKKAASLTGYAQDYIGYLARGGHVESQRVGGLWYLNKEAVLNYKPAAGSTREKEKTVDPVEVADRESESSLTFEGKEYISASRASEITGYNQDYVGQLARSGTIDARQVGNRWFVEMENIVEHKKEKDALLAAVQASAVGLAKQPQQSVPIRIQNEKGEEYVYSNEDVDLVPMIPEISTMDEAVTQANEDQEVVVNSIPIHVLREMEFQDLPTARIQQTSSIFSNRPWQFMLMAGRVPAALTVVIILSLFGYFSFSKNAQYASVASSSVNQSGSTLVNDISKWVSYIGTKELIYIRK